MVAPSLKKSVSFTNCYYTVMSNHPSGSWHVPINRQCQDSTFTLGKPSHWSFKGSGKSRRLFKLVAVTSLSRVGQIFSPPALYGNPGGISHIHASMVYLQLCLQSFHRFHPQEPMEAEGPSSSAHD